MTDSKSTTLTVMAPPASVDPDGKALATWGILRRTMLHQNYPNPFNPDTWIPYQLVDDVDVEISIYDVSGKVIRSMSLGNLVWFDIDNDGLFDLGTEVGIAGVTVELTLMMEMEHLKAQKP